MFPGQNKRAVLAWLVWCALVSRLWAAEGRAFHLGTNDVVAFVGGTDVATARLTGHLEALLAIKFPGARFRNLGWEGDTVFAQPRDVGFPLLGEQLKRIGATVIFLQFGRAEALEGRNSAAEFAVAYDRLIAGCLKQTPRLVLVTPAPFEKGEAPLPDLSSRNAALAAHCEAIREIARRSEQPLVDLFRELGGATHQKPRLTENGLELTARGHAFIAAIFTRQLGFGDIAARPARGRTRTLKTCVSSCWRRTGFGSTAGVPRTGLSSEVIASASPAAAIIATRKCAGSRRRWSDTGR